MHRIRTCSTCAGQAAVQSLMSRAPVAPAAAPERALAWLIESRRREHSVALHQWRSHDLLAG
ncbi:hypothetical protein DSI35_14340 [Mycobacterium tuberculosis]|uniref:Uncharacterized protein n=3 Tax=Mycobacterium tuberculosis complex TaxID=77643 RepID=A0AB73YJC2_MYCTX|nr:hypothetical protein Mb1595_p1071 [Mycobacterium tuberculosis variant bovis]APR56405.1 hypothetical protein BTU11_05170 [Mycobacterium tuberculosis]AYP11407.1 hypothetical protein EBQ37_05655 [Mycobacterium tuberculosis variant bovis BCG]ORT90100.1 hypothetical protein BS299_08820 [Mycobacterium tuberculosis M13]PRH89854.1 hypothetical protein B8A26_21220 [Mycobacterium tuberculosis variant pinnipedii]PRH94207.1 hypothetical protein B8A28_19075 [Mycobacterium tuberculosis variant caprae]PR